MLYWSIRVGGSSQGIRAHGPGPDQGVYTFVLIGVVKNS